MITVHSPDDRTVAHYVATTIGGVFILVGLFGIWQPTFMGMHLTGTHNLVHLVSGVLSLYVGLRGSAAAARAFCLTFGAVYALLGVAGMAFGVPGSPTMAGMPPDARLLRVLPGRLELGTMDHAIHVVIGVGEKEDEGQGVRSRREPRRRQVTSAGKRGALAAFGLRAVRRSVGGVHRVRGAADDATRAAPESAVRHPLLYPQGAVAIGTREG